MNDWDLNGRRSDIATTYEHRTNPRKVSPGPEPLYGCHFERRCCSRPAGILLKLQPQATTSKAAPSENLLTKQEIPRQLYRDELKPDTLCPTRQRKRGQNAYHCGPEHVSMLGVQSH